MKKTQLLISFLLLSFISIAQTKTQSKEEKVLVDSMMASDEALKMLMDEPKNYVDVSIGFGNASFSNHNNAINATGVAKQLVITPSLQYHFKNGISVGLTPYLTKDSNSLKLYQTALSIGYDYEDDKIKTGISYTRYLSKKNEYNSKSIYQNDFYGYIKKATGIIQPGINLGFANGDYKESNYASFKKLIHLPLPLPNGRDTLVTFTGLDSTDNKSSYFSVSATLGHDFYFYNLFNSKDELDFTPTIMLNAGSDKNSYTHTNAAFKNAKPNSPRKKNQSGNSNNKFQAQSIGASFDFTYSVGKFYVQPNIYFDYYLPSTTSNRFSSIVSLTAGITF